jgi:hypothetical protein
VSTTTTQKFLSESYFQQWSPGMEKTLQYTDVVNSQVFRRYQARARVRTHTHTLNRDARTHHTHTINRTARTHHKHTHTHTKQGHTHAPHTHTTRTHSTHARTRTPHTKQTHVIVANGIRSLTLSTVGPHTSSINTS